MNEQLIPLYILAAIFGLYTIKSIVVYLWDESTQIAANEELPLSVEDWIKQTKDKHDH
jgi:hypothetical protein